MVLLQSGNFHTASKLKYLSFAKLKPFKAKDSKIQQYQKRSSKSMYENNALLITLGLYGEALGSKLLILPSTLHIPGQKRKYDLSRLHG